MDDEEVDLEEEVRSFIELWDESDQDMIDTVLTCFCEEAWPTRKTQDN